MINQVLQRTVAIWISSTQYYTSEVVETRRGKKCVAINNFKFSEFRENKEKGKFVRCTNTI